MADDSDIPWGEIIGAAGSMLNSQMTSDKASGISQAAYDEMLRNLRERFADYDALGTAGYEQYVPATIGRSALSGIQEDPGLRQAQQETLAALKDIIDSGGLTLSDMKALNDVQRNLNQNNTARRKGLTNEFAARGQLGAGAQMAMALQGQQDDAENANQRGEATAAQAQDRALGATMKRGAFAGEMSAEDYKRQKAEADAADFIERWNASTRNDGAKYRNSIKGQAFGDGLAKARGKTSLTDSTNSAVFGKGRDAAGSVETQGKLRNNFIQSGTNAFTNSGGGKSSMPDGSPYNDEDLNDAEDIRDSDDEE